MEIDLKSIWQDYGLEELRQGLKSLFPEYEISLAEVFEKVLAGDILGAGSILIQNGLDGILLQLTGLRNIFLWLVLLGIAAAIMTHFVEIFDKHQVADLSFYFIYLLFTTILFQCFMQTSDIAVELLSDIVLFIQLMVPTYLIAVGVAGGGTTVSAYSQLLTLVVYGVEQILCQVVVKLVSVYVVLSMVNGIWIEEKLGMLTDLLKKFISFVLKAALGVVTGVSIFQTLITPMIDSARSSVLQKAISVIPGVGNLAEGVAELVVGSAVIIKNSIGVVLLLLLLFICAAPLLKIYIIVWILRLAAAVLGMVCDKRLAGCTDRMSEGCMFMFRTASTAMILFLIIIAVIATTANRGF